LDGRKVCIPAKRQAYWVRIVRQGSTEAITKAELVKGFIARCVLHSWAAILVGGAATSLHPAYSAETNDEVKYEVVVLDDEKPPATLHIMSCASDLKKRPAILTLGALKEGDPPEWSV